MSAAAATRPRIGLSHIVAIALVWALAMAATGAVSLVWMRGWALDAQTQTLIGILAVGGFFGIAAARMLLGFVPDNWASARRFSLAFILIGSGTVGFTSLLFALQFLAYFTQWHDDHASVRLLFETVFTLLSACYQFLVLGLRLYIPFGLLALTIAAWAFAQRRI